MPSKFVARAAERTGVSLETAEHRWAEAKKKVHKGKRRGSWYWGKVMNTFKRMMGLMEAVTFKEWALFEGGGMFDHWPEMIKLYGPYVAVRTAEEDGYVTYRVEIIMGEPTGVALTASKIRGGPMAGGAAYTLGLDNDFTQGLGINTYTPGESEFKEWATDAMKSASEKLRLTEGVSLAKGTKDWPKEFMLKDGYYAEFHRQGPMKLAYRIKRLMDDELKGYVRVSGRPGNLAAGGKKTFKYYWQIADENDRPAATLRVSETDEDPHDFATFKHWVSTQVPILLKEGA
jgi:hypothetical protein